MLRWVLYELALAMCLGCIHIQRTDSNGHSLPIDVDADSGGCTMITVSRDKAKRYIENLYEDTVQVSEEQIDLFIEYVEIYGLSERMEEDYTNDPGSPTSAEY